MLKQNTKRDAELLTAILPCQSCIYSTQEYNYHYVFIRNPKDVITKEQIAKGEGYRVSYFLIHSIQIFAASFFSFIKELVQFVYQQLLNQLQFVLLLLKNMIHKMQKLWI